MGININDYIVSENDTIIDAMKAINRSDNAVAFVCIGRKLLATISNGDVRRYIINGGDLGKKISDIANYSPIYIKRDEKADYQAFMKSKKITALPIVNDELEIIDIEFTSKPSFEKREVGIPVVIMAGGKGTRLKPYTDILPKPLIPIGSKTITEHIMDRFREYKCNHFDMIVNYKKEFIKSYFQDNEMVYDMRFVDEPEFWGTAGGLKLVEGYYDDTFFVTNCDILVDADYRDIYEYHKNSKNVITMICAKKKVVIPYGTVEITDEGQITSLKEKPSFEFNTNTGMYMVEPDFINLIPKNTKIDITDMIQLCIDKGLRVGTYLISEDDWLDMGQMEELKRMKDRLNVE